MRPSTVHALPEGAALLCTGAVESVLPLCGRILLRGETPGPMAVFFFVLHAVGWKYGQELAPQDPLYLQATTACLSAIIVMQIVNVFVCRNASRSVLSTGVLENPLILWGVALEIALVLPIQYTPWGNLLIGTSPVAGPVWLLIIPFAAAMLALEELRKWLVRGPLAEKGAQPPG